MLKNKKGKKDNEYKEKLEKYASIHAERQKKTKEQKEARTHSNKQKNKYITTAASLKSCQINIRCIRGSLHDIVPGVV